MAITFSWDEPEGCTSARGWASFDGPHPDDKPHYKVKTVCGWYLDYAGCDSRGPDGGQVLAAAYLFREGLVSSTDRLGNSWFWTVEEAKAWIERAVSLRLEELTAEVAG